MAKAYYFAGLPLRARRGLSSDDVVLYKLLESNTEKLDDIAIFFLPTVSSDIRVEEDSRARIWVHQFNSWNDYMIMTRPLAFSLEEAERLAQTLKLRSDAKVVASFASSRLSSLRALAERFADKVDGFEIDLGLTYILSGGRRGFESYVIDMLEEFVSESARPVIVKLSPAAPPTQEFLRHLKTIGVGAVIFSPHVVYSLGNEFFRVHSTYLSKVYALIWAKLATTSDVPSAYISDIPEHLLGDFAVERSFDIILYDTALLHRVASFPQVKRLGDEFLVRWSSIHERMRPAFNLREEPPCVDVCPFRAFTREGEATGITGDFLVASEKCDRCGLCLSCCKSARLVAVISPEE